MKTIKRQSSVIDKSELRRRMEQYAKDTRYHFLTRGVRISEVTLADAEAVVWAWAKRKIDGAPSKGKTI